MNKEENMLITVCKSSTSLNGSHNVCSEGPRAGFEPLTENKIRRAIAISTINGICRSSRSHVVMRVHSTGITCKLYKLCI